MAIPKYSPCIWLYSHSLKSGDRHPLLSLWKNLTQLVQDCQDPIHCVNPCLANTKCSHSARAAMVGCWTWSTRSTYRAWTKAPQHIFPSSSEVWIKPFRHLFQKHKIVGKRRKSIGTTFCIVLYCFVLSFLKVLFISDWSRARSKDYSYNRWTEFDINNFTITIFLWFTVTLLNIVLVR